jgi:hypothetical protein
VLVPVVVAGAKARLVVAVIVSASALRRLLLALAAAAEAQEQRHWIACPQPPRWGGFRTVAQAAMVVMQAVVKQARAQQVREQPEAQQEGRTPREPEPPDRMVEQGLCERLVAHEVQDWTSAAVMAHTEEEKEEQCVTNAAQEETKLAVLSQP